MVTDCKTLADQGSFTTWHRIQNTNTKEQADLMNHIFIFIGYHWLSLVIIIISSGYHWLSLVIIIISSASIKQVAQLYPLPIDHGLLCLKEDEG